ncbi:MAG: Nif3-like dinuclear metal center hexameric protein [Gemmatimonadaceae bacterium]|nr:Nif3-like dinuclear metal center hexameric protein [Gemmatimonadaceae bacterium]
MTVTLSTVAAYLDDLLQVSTVPDFPHALNGVQVSHRGPITAIATAVDACLATATQAAAAGANLLMVHHGLFWSGLQPQTGRHYERMRFLVEHDVAVYSAHLPLDAHGTFGNSRLLANRLGLHVAGGFATYQGVFCGVHGTTDMPTELLVRAADTFATEHGGRARASRFSQEHRTRRWAICSGSGADASFLAEAESMNIDTLVVGEGPHWSAVEAPERGLVIIYAGHYATETLGIESLGRHVAATFNLRHEFIAAPTGL